MPRVVFTDCPESGVGLMDDLILSLAQEFAQLGDDRLAESLDIGILQQLLSQPVLLVIDEFQRSFVNSPGQPVKPLASWLERINKNRSLLGRVLLLSSREVERERWNERCAFKSLGGLSPDDGQTLLGQLLHDEALPDDVLPIARRRDVSKWLGGYPRALRLLVSRLRYDSLDELIGLEPEAWEGRDREVSTELLQRFERRMLSRARDGLPPMADRFFGRLAVFRRPVDRHALEAVSRGFEPFETLRDELIARFILLVSGKF